MSKNWTSRFCFIIDTFKLKKGLYNQIRLDYFCDPSAESIFIVQVDNLILQIDKALQKEQKMDLWKYFAHQIVLEICFIVMFFI